MGFLSIFESALDDFLRKYHGGKGYKNARKELKRDFKRAEVRKDVERVKATWKDVDNNYIRLCKKYPHLDMASTNEWDRRLTDEYKVKYAKLRAEIDRRRTELGLNV